MRIVFLNKQEKAGSSGSIYPDVLANLEARGVTVENAVPETRLYDMDALETDANLYVLRTRSTVGLNLAAALEVAGARLLIPFARERVLRNKFLIQQKLIAAGIPAPRSYLLWSREQIGPLVDQHGPLVVKHSEGHGGQGVFMVNSRQEADGLPEMDGPLFVQERVEGTGSDLKVYQIGARLAALRRVFPARTPEEKRGVPAEVTPDVADIARRCDEAFGLGLAGVDMLETANGPVVIDINSMPGYKGIENAAALVADFIHERAEGRA